MTHTLSAILSACASPVALFSDFDGTLVEIAPQPNAVHVPASLPTQLQALDTALGGAFAIVTGRPISEIDDFLNLPRLTVSGGHGAERRRNGRYDPPPSQLTQHAKDAAAAVRAMIGTDERIIVETKPSGVAVHYRAAPEREADARIALENATSGLDLFHIIKGKKVVEARPRSTDKGEAVRLLMQEQPFHSRIPVFVGDDMTDEDAFAAVAGLDGFGVKIGAGDTQARFRLPDVAAVYALFDAVAKRAMASDRTHAQTRLDTRAVEEAGTS